MKILFLSPGDFPDYLCDMAFHGMKILGHEVTDVNKLTYMYESYPREQVSKLYGKGFTLYGRLKDNGSVDRSHIEKRIKSKEFDMIVYGSIRRYSEYFNLVHTVYDQSKILMLDGEDNQDIEERFMGKGVYYKRELAAASTSVKSVCFAIPSSLIRNSEMSKTQLLATCDPRNKESYIFQSEEEYYDAYSTSYWAVTTKKGGWDCLRHYEIIAAGALPYFPDIFDCPATILTSYPKFLVYESNRLFLSVIKSTASFTEWEPEYWRLHKKIMEHFTLHCTTDKLAARILNRDGI